MLSKEGKKKINVFQMHVSQMPDRAIQLCAEFSPLGNFKLGPKQYLLISLNCEL